MTTKEELFESAKRRAQSWLCPELDPESRREIERMLEQDHQELTEAFHSELEFGTGGLRGVMGVGSMRMNRYTIGMATQGLANYIRRQKPDGLGSVAIAFDCRNRSSEFAQTAADVLSANGIRVYLYPELRPTPLLSFTVRELGCTAGIVITASHNPKEYNGFKVYWEDGAQVLPPHDKGIINEVRAIKGISDVRFNPNPSLITAPGEQIEQGYLDRVDGLIHAHDAIRKASNLRIVYTAIHGTGQTMVPRALRKAGFAHVFEVESQSTFDGNFPTVISPNPEEREALSLALKLAEEVKADLLMGNDPDADRVGIAIRNPKGEMVLLNGNQAGSLLVWYELSQWKSQGKLNGHQYIASTIVTSDLFPAIGEHFGVPCYKTLTGFKYIAGVMREKEGTEEFVAGGEESYGYLAGDFVRDKDAVISSVKFAEIAAWCRDKNMTMWELMMQIYSACGLYFDELVSVTLKGIDGMQKINEMMSRFRNTPPLSIAGSTVKDIADIQKEVIRDVATGKETPLDLPPSNVIQFVLEDGSRISVRPSGTEPKIKFYFSFRATFSGQAHYDAQSQSLAGRVQAARTELGLS